MGSVSGASVAIGARPSQQHHNMVMRATVVVFTIVLIIAGVFASEIAKEQNGELAEDDILQLSHSLQETQSNLDDLEDLNVHVKRDAVADQKKKIKKMGKLQEKEIRKRRLENPNLKEKAKLERGKGNLRSSKKVRNHPQRKRKRMAIENQRNLKVRNQENQRKRKQKNKEKRKERKVKQTKERDQRKIK